MSTYDLEEQEQLAALKAWWKEYSGLVTVAIFVVFLILAAWMGWNWYQRQQAAQAADAYEQLQKAANANDLKSARDAAGAILEQHPRTIYAALAALISAKVHFQAGDLKTARAQLEWAMKHARSDEIRSIARLRLANVLIDDGAVEEAAKLMEAKPPAGYEGLFSATRGDVFLAQKRTADARAAYQAAIAGSSKLDPAMRELVQLKLDALGDS